MKAYVTDTCKLDGECVVVSPVVNLPVIAPSTRVGGKKDSICFLF